jgi:hypothetical protein
MSAAQAAATKKLAEALASDPFTHGDDLHIDWSGVPSMRPLMEQDTSWIDDEFAPLDTRGSGIGSQDLKAFIEQEATRAQGPGQVNLGKDVIGKVVHDGKEWLCNFTYEGKLRRTKAASYDDCVMQAARFVFNHQDHVRQLTAEEEQLVTWTAQSGKAVQAAERYIRFAIPRAGELGERVLTDPRFSETVDAAVFFAWSRARNDYSLSDRDFPKFLKRFARHKRMTLAICDSAYQRYLEAAKRAERTALLTTAPEPEPTAEDFDEMSDTQIDAAYRGIARELARR